MDRVKQIAAHLTGTSNVVDKKGPDDVVITLAIRTPLCKAKKGALRDARTDELLLELFKHTVSKSNIKPEQVGDITVGTVLTPRAMWVARGAALAAGYPASTPVNVVNRFCSSGLMAVGDIANKIRAGQIEVGLAVGIESMSENPDDGAPVQSPEISAHAQAKDCAMPMGWTSENVAQDFSVSREDQDAFAARSFQRAEAAQKGGRFNEEIVPVTVYQKDKETGEKRKVVVDKDDGIRYGTTAQGLSKIRSAFPQWGNSTTTGGNASQITDGAAAVLLMTRRRANELGLEIMGRYIQTCTTGVEPRVMGIGPVSAIQGVLRMVGLTKEEVDLFEINEAFASQCLYTCKALQLDQDKVNVNGGAIALGHPLGCTGARQVATGLHELKRRGGKVLVTGMCIGTGMGAAAVFVRE